VADVWKRTEALTDEQVDLRAEVRFACDRALRQELLKHLTVLTLAGTVISLTLTSCVGLMELGYEVVGLVLIYVVLRQAAAGFLTGMGGV